MRKLALVLCAVLLAAGLAVTKPSPSVQTAYAWGSVTDVIMYDDRADVGAVCVWGVMDNGVYDVRCYYTPYYANWFRPPSWRTDPAFPMTVKLYSANWDYIGQNDIWPGQSANDRWCFSDTTWAGWGC